MSRKPHSPSEIIDGLCTRCKTVTNHTIVAMVGTQIASVQCNTCGGIHKHRPGKTAKAPTEAGAPAAKPATAPRKPRLDPVAAERAEWEKRSPGFDPGKARPYDMQTSYRSGDLVDHPLFGLGQVQRRNSPNSVEILFATGLKLLRCG